MNNKLKYISYIYNLILVALLLANRLRYLSTDTVFLIAGVCLGIVIAYEYTKYNSAKKNSLTLTFYSTMFYLIEIVLLYFENILWEIINPYILYNLIFTGFIVFSIWGLFKLSKGLNLYLDHVQMVLNLFTFYAIFLWCGYEALSDFFVKYETIYSVLLYYPLILCLISVVFAISLLLCIENVNPPSGIVGLLVSFMVTYGFFFFYITFLFNKIAVFETLALLFMLASCYLTGKYFKITLNSLKGSEDCLFLDGDQSNLNINRSTFNLSFGFIIVILLPTTLFFVKKISINTLVLCLVISSLYYLLSIFYQSFIVKKNLLDYNLRQNQRMEEELNIRKQQILLSNEALKNQSQTDFLTKTWNRDKFYLDAQQLQDSNTPFALIYLDLDRFKVINDTYGHDTGDVILAETARRFKRFSNDDTSIYRIGGDEFIVLSKIIQKDKLTQLTLEIINSVQVPYIHENISYYLGISVGIAMYPTDATDIDTLIKYADFTMYRTKQSYSQNKFGFFTQKYYLEIERKNRIIYKLENSDYSKFLHLHYQPIFYSGGKKIKKLEALLRWYDDELGKVSPTEFIPLAEQTNSIFAITQWLIDQSFSDLSRLKKDYGANFSIAINISPKALTQNPLIYNLLLKSSHYDIDPSEIELELTENLSVYLIERVQEKILVLDQHNFTISIDDFGTGFSSLEYLKDLKIDTLKIAKELVDNIEQKRQDYSLIGSIIKLSKALNLDVIAEGVEKYAQYDILESLGCDYYQGFYFERPIDFDTLTNRYLQPDNPYNVG